MEKISNFSWALIGTRPNDDNELSEDDISLMMTEAFIEGKTFQLFLWGALIEKFGTLEEMESGLELIMKEMEDYQPGCYSIVSRQTKGDLLFAPVIIEEGNESIGGDSNLIQG